MTETDRFDEEDVEKQYTVESDGVPARVTIGEPEDEYVLLYLLERPEIDEATEALLNDIRKELIQEVSLTTEEFVDSKALDEVKEKFRRTASGILENRLAETNDRTRDILIGNLIHDMLGLGDIELLLSDNSLEEIVVNGSDECASCTTKNSDGSKPTFSSKTRTRSTTTRPKSAARSEKKSTPYTPCSTPTCPAGTA